MHHQRARDPAVDPVVRRRDQSLRTAPVDGAANAELIDVLAAALRVPRRTVALVGGERSRTKRVRIDGLDEAAVTARLSP